MMAFFRVALVGFCLALVLGSVAWSAESLSQRGGRTARGQCKQQVATAVQALVSWELNGPGVDLRSVIYQEVCVTDKNHDIYLVDVAALPTLFERLKGGSPSGLYGAYIVTVDYRNCRIIGVNLQE